MKAPVESRPLRKRSPAADLWRVRWRRAALLLWRDIRRHPALTLLLCGYVAIFATGWWFYFTMPDPAAVGGGEPSAEQVLQQSGRELLSPRPGAVFGTDRYGVGVLTRVLRGSAETLSAALLGSAMAVAIGFLLILTVGWLLGPGGYRFMAWISGGFACLPAVVLAWWLSSALEPGFWTVTGVIAVTGAVVATGRLATIFEESESAWHVIAARASGLGRFELLRTQVLGFVWRHLVSFGAMLLPGAILLETALSFAGFGLGPGSPDSWGRLIAEGRSLMFEAPWLLIAPGLVIAATVGWLSLTARSIRKVTREKEFLSLV